MASLLPSIFELESDVVYGENNPIGIIFAIYCMSELIRKLSQN